MKHYLITGGAGFIGSHLAESLLRAGHSVSIIDDLSTGRWDNIAHLEKQFSAFRAVIASTDEKPLLEAEVPKHDFVFHLASAVGVQLIIDRPVETVQRIVRTTDALVEVCAKYRRPLLLTSTSEVYGKSEAVPFCEEADTTLGSTSKRRWAYAAAKMLDEFLVLAHYYQTSLPVYIVRLFNTVGPRQSGQYGMVLPRFVEAAKHNKPLKVFGDGQQQRCFCSVFDIVDALQRFETKPQTIGKVVNLGSSEEVSIYQLAERVIKILNSQSAIDIIPYQDAYGPGFDDMRRRVPCLQRAEEYLGWKPTTSLDNIIRSVAEN
jgi:UDP-glucose 4-epimerase